MERKLLRNFFILPFIICLILIKTGHAENKLTFSGFSEASPLVWVENNELKGASIDLITLILSDLNIPYRSYILPWKRQLHSLKNGQLDLILTLYWTNEREKIYDLTIPYTQKNVFIYVKTGKEFAFEKWEDLIGKYGVISLGTSKGEKFDKFMLKNLTVEETVNLTASVKMLKLGRVDYLIGGDSSTHNTIKELGFEGKIKALQKPLVIQNLHMDISKKYQYRKYLSQINKKV